VNSTNPEYQEILLVIRDLEARTETLGQQIASAQSPRDMLVIKSSADCIARTTCASLRSLCSYSDRIAELENKPFPFMDYSANCKILTPGGE